MTDHQNAINPGARSSVGISLAPGPSSTACDDQFTSEADALRAELEHRTAYLIAHRDAYSDEKLRADAAEAQVVRLREALNLALEYWADRQQRYRNRAPVWAGKARAALSQEQS